MGPELCHTPRMKQLIVILTEHHGLALMDYPTYGLRASQQWAHNHAHNILPHQIKCKLKYILGLRPSSTTFTLAYFSFLEELTVKA